MDVLLGYVIFARRKRARMKYKKAVKKIGFYKEAITRLEARSKDGQRNSSKGTKSSKKRRGVAVRTDD